MGKGKQLRFAAIAHSEGFANEFTAENGIGRIRVPYGEYEYGEARCPDGRTRRVVQIWDEASARAVRDALPNEGYPVYQGHPDVPDVAAKYPNKAAVGWVTGIEVANDAAVLAVEWIDNPGRGFKWFSPYWRGFAEEPPGPDEARVHIEALTSVGLVNNPRIRQFTLANEWSGADAPAPTPGSGSGNTNEETQMDIKKLAVLLGLNVEGLTEDQVVAEITRLQQVAVEAADNATAQVKAARDETAAARQNVAAKEQELAAAKEQFANERAARVELLLDNAIAGGNITPAGKAAWRERLGKDIDAGTTALFNERAVKTEAVATAKAAKGHERHNALLDFANELVRKDGMDFHTAFLRAKSEHPELAR